MNVIKRLWISITGGCPKGGRHEWFMVQPRIERGRKLCADAAPYTVWTMQSCSKCFVDRPVPGQNIP